MIKPHLTKWGDTGTESHKSVKIRLLKDKNLHSLDNFVYIECSF